MIGAVSCFVEYLCTGDSFLNKDLVILFKILSIQFIQIWLIFMALLTHNSNNYVAIEVINLPKRDAVRSKSAPIFYLNCRCKETPAGYLLIQRGRKGCEFQC